MGNSVSQTDLQKYALKSDIESEEFVKNQDLKKLNLIYQTRGNYALNEGLELIYQTKGNYVLSSDLAGYQTRGNYVLSSDLTGYAQSTTLSNYQTRGNYVLSSDLAGYAQSSNLSNYQTRGNYVLSSDLAGYQTKGNYILSSDLDNYQLKGDYALKTELPVVPANIATKEDLANYQPKGEYALKSQISAQQDLSKYALKKELPVVPANIATKGDLNAYQLKGDTTLELKDSKANSNAPFITLYNSGGGAGNQVGIKLNPWSGRSGGDSSQIVALDDGAASSHLLFYTASGPTGKSTERMRIKSDGGVQVKGNLDTASLSIGGTELKPANFATKGDLSVYALKTEIKASNLDNYQTKGNYALSSDLTNYVLKTDISKNINTDKICKSDGSKCISVDQINYIINNSIKYNDNIRLYSQGGKAFLKNTTTASTNDKTDTFAQFNITKW